jgi:hypothetical protein
MEAWRLRREEREPFVRSGEQIAAIYHDEIVVPALTEDGQDMPTIVNTFALGIDGMGQRISSTMPIPYFSNPGETPLSLRRARDRRDVVLSWWEADRLELKLGTMGRWWAAYASDILDVRPYRSKGRPEYVVRNPLLSWPSGDEVECEDAIFMSIHSRTWLDQHFPNEANSLKQGFDRRGVSDPCAEIELIEYVSAEERVYLARFRARAEDQSTIGARDYVRLPSSFKQNLYYCPVSSVGRPGLKRPIGQFNGMVGAYYQQALLQNLEILGTKRTINPQLWFVARDGEQPNIIVHANPEENEPGIVSGGQLQVVTPQGGFQANTTIDRLERNQRASGRIPAEFAGESTSTVRTGRRGDSIMAATVDFPVAEAQRHFARLLECADKAAIATDLYFFGGRQKHVVVNWSGARDRQVDYDPAKLWSPDDADSHRVEYSHPGSDANNVVIALLQRKGAGTMSARTMMRLDPMIDDDEAEHDQVIYEQLEQAIIQSVLAQAQQGAIPPMDVARIAELVQMDKAEIWDAIMTAQKESQARQAQAAPPGAPETQPGLGPPGQGAEQPTAGPGELPQGLHSALQNLSALRMMNRQSPVANPASTPAERGA